MCFHDLIAHFFWTLNNFPLSRDIIVYLSIHPLKDIIGDYEWSNHKYLCACICVQALTNKFSTHWRYISKRTLAGKILFSFGKKKKTPPPNWLQKWPILHSHWQWLRVPVAPCLRKHLVFSGVIWVFWVFIILLVV